MINLYTGLVLLYNHCVNKTVQPLSYITYSPNIQLYRSYNNFRQLARLMTQAYNPAQLTYPVQHDTLVDIYPFCVTSNFVLVNFKG